MTKAINTYNNLRKAEARRGLYDAEAVLAAMLHVAGGDNSGESNNEDVTLKAIKKYKADLNYKTSAWDKLDTETNLKVLTGLLLDWLEHLKVIHSHKGRTQSGMLRSYPFLIVKHKKDSYAYSHIVA